MIKNVNRTELKGEIEMPPSKSDGQRAILAAALAEGESRIENLGKSNDELAMLAAVKTLGATVKQQEHALLLTGPIHENRKQSVFVGESGLALRLLIPVCVSIGGDFRFEGEGTLRDREHTFFERTIDGHGITITSNRGHLPIQCSGQLEGGTFTVDGSGSSQYISGLLMALPLLKKDSLLEVIHATSKPYIAMTLNTLKAFGIQITDKGDNKFQIPGSQNYQATTYTVEGDWSSASYWLVAAALGHQVKIRGLNPDSLQADRALLSALRAAGCEVWFDEDGSIGVNGANKKSFDFDATDCPDLFPALVSLASFCEGITSLKGLKRLRNKETDRGIVLQSEFAKLGVQLELDGDTMRIQGNQNKIGATVDSHGDHRIAMSLAITGTMINEGIQIENADAVAKSYPDFWRDLETHSVM